MSGDKLLKEYLQNSYARADGLWFLKTEKNLDSKKLLNQASKPGK